MVEYFFIKNTVFNQIDSDFMDTLYNEKYVNKNI